MTTPRAAFSNIYALNQQISTAKKNAKLPRESLRLSDSFKFDFIQTSDKFCCNFIVPWKMKCCNIHARAPLSSKSPFPLTFSNISSCNVKTLRANRLPLLVSIRAIQQERVELRMPWTWNPNLPIPVLQLLRSMVLLLLLIPHEGGAI